MKKYRNGTTISDQDYTALIEYESAQKAKVAAPFETRIWKEANKIVASLENVQITYFVSCMLCKEPFEFTVPITMAAEYHDAPRGICGKHNGPVTAVVEG